MKKIFFIVIAFPFFAYAQNVGINTTTPNEKFHLKGSFLISPFSFANDTIQNSSISNQNIFAYNASKGALRFGDPNGASNWYNNNVGGNSFAFGTGTQAIAAGSFAYGFNTIANGYYSTALGGYGSIANGYGAVAGGQNSKAKFDYSFAFGNNVISNFTNQIVLGKFNDSTVNSIFSIGNGTSLSNRNTAFSVANNGNVSIGVNVPQQPLSIDSFAVVDQGNHNVGTKPSLIFGSLSGEGIGSKRNSGTNNYGLDFYTNSLTRMAITNDGKVGIGTNTPSYALDVFDVANQGFFANFSSNNTSNTLIQIQNNASGTNTANIGLGLYRNGIAKGYLYVNGANNLVATTTSAEQLVLTPAGNFGIAQSSPNYPLNFANTLGDKISLYGNGTTSYGFGIQNNLLQIHTDGAGSDVAIGSGSSASFTERMRIKGNGNIGIGTNNPNAKLQIIKAGLYSNAEGNGNALEIIDTTATDHILYMGADATNQLSYIQSVASGGFRDLLLQGRGGNIIIGKDQNASINVKGDVVVDYNGSNNSTISNGIRLGSTGSGEGMASKRTSGGNQNGLDFYTASVNRMNITNAGQVNVVSNLTVQNGKGLVRNYNSTQLKTETFTFTNPQIFDANNTDASTKLSVTFPEAYAAAPMVYLSGLVLNGTSSWGYAECVYNIINITTTGFTLCIYNPRTAPYQTAEIFAGFQWNFVALGAQ